MAIDGSVSFKMAAKPKLVLAQDLMSDTPVDITADYAYSDGVLTIFGSVAKMLCSGQPKGDISASAIVFKAE